MPYLYLSFQSSLRFTLLPLLQPSQPYRQQHRYWQNKAKGEFPAHLKYIGTEIYENYKPDEFSQNVQLEKIAENKPHEEDEDAEVNKL